MKISRNFKGLPFRKSRRSLAFAFAALLLVLASAWFVCRKPAPTISSTASPTEPAGTAKSSQSLPLLTDDAPKKSEMASLWEAFDAARHEVTGLSEREAAMPQNAGVRFFASNPGQQLTARFLDQGVRIESGAGGGWKGTLQLTQISRAGTDAALDAADAPSAKGSKVEYKRGTVTEWYENRPEGFEQGFNLSENPVAAAAGAPLEVSLRFAGLKAAASSDASEINFTTAHGEPVVAYKGLKVWDANGAAVAAHMQAEGDQVTILVADAGAAYPLTIDPIVASLEQKLGPEVTGSGSPYDYFGSSVAVAGDTAIVGVPGDTTPAGPSAGSAYIFFRTGAVWNVQAHLTASDAGPNSRFGTAVAISGNTAVVTTQPYQGGIGSNQEPRPSEAFAAGSAYVFVRSGSAWTQQAILSPTGEMSFTFGYGCSVAIAGDTVVVGDSYWDLAYVFVRSGTTWTLQTTLTSDEGYNGIAFGASVSISGDSVIVGAPLAGASIPANGIGGYFTGAAYIFVRSGETWTFQQEFFGEATYDYFGSSVSIFGDAALVGAPGADSAGVIDCGTAYLYERTGTSWSLNGTLNADDKSMNAGFGASVSLGNGRALIGAPHVNGAYVFEPGGSGVLAVGPPPSNWEQTAKLAAADTEQSDHFGGAVSLSGDTALVGVPYDDTPAGQDAGTAFVFVYGEDTCCDGSPASTGGWCQQARLTGGESGANDHFGRPLAVDGDTLVVGAQLDDTAAGIDTGSVYVFSKVADMWTFQSKLVPQDVAPSDGFGRAIAINGNTILGSSPNANTGAGSAYLFVRNGQYWTQSAKLVGKGLEDYDNFGRSVSLTANTAAVSAYCDDTPAGQNAGSVFIFLKAGTKWTQQAQLFADDAAPYDLFGQSISMSGNTLLIGAMGVDGGTPGGEKGAAYVFVRSGKTWSQQAKLAPSDVAANDAVGHSVALFENTALISADGADTTGGTDAGAAYIFNRIGTNWTQTQKLTADDAAAGDGFGRIVALTDGLALVGAPSDDTTGGSNAGSAYVFARSAGSWSQNAHLMADDAGANDLFGWALAVTPSTAFVGADSADGVDLYGGPVVDQGRVYVFDLRDTSAPEIAVALTDHTNLIDGQTTPVDFGGTVVGTTSETIFLITNEGGTNLTGIKITVDGTNKSEFKVLKAPSLTLAPKATMAVAVTFAPGATGTRTANLHIASNDSDENPFDIPVTGMGLPPVAPEISALEDRLVPANSSVRFATVVTGAPTPAITWKRNNVVIPKQKSPTLIVRANLPKAGANNAGLYTITATNSAGSAMESAELGIVDTSRTKQIQPTGGTATMTVRAAGNNLQFVWLKDGVPLDPDSVFVLDPRFKISADGKTLTIKNLEIGDMGTYACQVTGPGGVLLGGFCDLIVIDIHPAILEPVMMPDGQVGVAYKFTIPVDPDPIRTPTSYGATGLPSGLKVDAATGMISGKPKTSGFFQVTLSASNYWGKATADAVLYVAPLQALDCNLVGTFNGLVDRDGGVNGGFGGTIVLTTTSTGSFTGQLTLAGVKYPFDGDIATFGNPATAKVTVKRTVSKLPPIVLQFALSSYEGSLTGSIIDSSVFPYGIADLAGSPLVPDFADGKGVAARFDGPSGIVRDKFGNLFVADTQNHVIRKVSSTGEVTTIAGQAGYCGSTDGPVAIALFHCPQGVAVDADGTLYVADTGNSVIRKITPDGMVTTLAGSAGSQGSVNGTGAAARFVCPVGIVIDAAGNLLVSDHEDHTIRKVTQSGVVTTFAGKSGTPGATNGSGGGARFNAPAGLAMSAKGVLIVADSGNHAVRAVSKTGAVTTLAGALGVSGFADGLSANARFKNPLGVAIDTAGVIFVADTGNCTLRRINAYGVVTTVAGKVGTPGIDGGIGELARFESITGLALNAKTVYITDAGGHIVRVGTAKPAGSVPVLAYRNPWGNDTMVRIRSASGDGRITTPGQGYCYRPPASSYEGAHNVAFDLGKNESGDAAYPQGNGFVTLNITSMGNVTWAGFMADGTAVTGSTMLGGTYYTPLNNIPLHMMMYGNTGSAQGWQCIIVSYPTGTASVPKTSYYETFIDGLLDWMKIPQATSGRNYNDGIPLHVQQSIGERNVPPSSGQIVLNLPPFQNNAMVSFYEGGLNPEFSQTFTITSSNAVQMPSGAGNPHSVKVTLTVPNSKFSGNFTLQDSNPVQGGTPPQITRVPAFNGVLMRRLDRGVGYFLLPQLPSDATTPPTTINTSPILSGQVVIEAARMQQD